MDVDWTAEFATAKWIRPWTGANAAAVSKGVLPGPLKTATWNGKLYAAPINSNTELLWYRKDLVPNPPKTWNQMIDDAIQLAKQGKPHYIEEQGAKYEGLTVWFNSLVDSAGGGILTPDNKVIVGHTTETAAAIMHRLANSPAADPGLNVAEEGAVRDRLGARHRRLPDQLPVRLVGGQGRQPEHLQAHGLRAVPERHPGHRAARSRSAATTSASRPTRRIRSSPSTRSSAWSSPRTRSATRSRAAWPRCWPASTTSPSFEKAYPFHALIKAQLEDYGIRPQTPAYADITLAIQDALSPTSSIDPNTIVSTLRSEIKNALVLGGAAVTSGTVTAPGTAPASPRRRRT